MAALRRRQGQLEAQARAAEMRAEELDVELRKKTAQVIQLFRLLDLAVSEAEGAGGRSAQEVMPKGN